MVQILMYFWMSWLSLAAAPVVVDEAGWLGNEEKALVRDIEDVEKYGNLPLRIWISDTATTDPGVALRKWLEERGEANAQTVALGVFPRSHRMTWWVGEAREQDLLPGFLERVLREIVSPQVQGKAYGQALLGAVGAVALKTGYSVTRWSRPSSASNASILALLALGLALVGVGTYLAVSLFRMGAAGGILFIMYLSFGWFAYQEWFLWMGALGTGWAVLLFVLSRFTSIRLPTHPESPEPTRAPQASSETEMGFGGGRASKHW